MSKKLNIVIVGFGGMGGFHFEKLNLNEHYHVQGIYDIDEAVQKKAEQESIKAYASLEEVVNDETVDAVLIATPNDSHKSISIQALQHDKHVICEKPVTLTSEDLKEIIDVAAKQNKVFIVHQNRRWDDDFHLVKSLYQTKQIGEIFHIESRVHGANGIPGDWRKEELYGGGMLYDWGVHLLDQLLWLFDYDVDNLSGELSYILGNDVDDGFTVHLNFKDVTTIVEVSTTSFIKLPRWYVKGTEGTAVIHDWDLQNEVVCPVKSKEQSHPKPIKAGAGLTKTMAPPSEDAVTKGSINAIDFEMESFYDNFYNTVYDNAEPIVKNEQVLKTMKIIEKVFEAVQNEKIIKF